MGFREKRAWIMLASTLGVYGVYFIAFGRAWATGQGVGLFAPMATAIVVLAIIQIMSLVGAAALAPSEARAPVDERDRAIDQAAARAGFYALQSGVALALAVVAFGIAPALAANALLAVMVLGEVTRAVWQIAGYRRSAA